MAGFGQKAHNRQARDRLARAGFAHDGEDLPFVNRECHVVDGADDAALIRGKKILLVDDVISTGGSLKAMEALVEKAGGTVAGRMAVLAEGGAADRKDILFLEKLPVFNADGSVK